LSRYVLVDGNNLLHRAYHIFVKDREPVLTSPTGYLTGLIYGSLSMLSDWIPAVSNPTKVLFFLDGIPARRKAMDPTYKVKAEDAENVIGTEPLTLSDGFVAKSDIDVIVHVLNLLGVDSYWHPEEEADDLIASFVRQRPDAVHVVMSTDKDFYQLLTSDKVILYRPGVEGSRFFDAERAEEHMHKLYKVRVPPANVRMFKTLTGDSSDGIRGVPHLRKKVAAPLCGSKDVDALLATGLPGFSKGEKEKAEALADRLRLNFSLVGLHDTVDVDSLRQSVPTDFQTASRILREDLGIAGVDVHSFRLEKPARTFVADAVETWLKDI
jgi:5'-3' exonuclease